MKFCLLQVNWWNTERLNNYIQTMYLFCSWIMFWPGWVILFFFLVNIIFFIIVVGVYLQKFLQYIIVEFTPSMVFLTPAFYSLYSICAWAFFKVLCYVYWSNYSWWFPQYAFIRVLCNTSSYLVGWKILLFF
jgi:hypothetical protein